MPTEDEFLGAIKMISGEEVLSKVSSVDDENGRYLILDNPIMVEEVTMDSRVGAKVSPWMKFSKERSFHEIGRSWRDRSMKFVVHGEVITWN